MITNTNKRVVCVKDIPSNMIEEAIFILKSDIEDVKNNKSKDTKKKLVLNETEEFLRTYSLDLENERLKEKNEAIKSKKIKMFLTTMVLIAIGVLFVFMLKI